MNKNFFEVKNVDFVVGGKTKVTNVSFAIEKEGDVICLLGPSGIGKTTILRTIAGLQKVKNGSIELRGKTLSTNKTNIEPEDRNGSSTPIPKAQRMYIDAIDDALLRQPPYRLIKFNILNIKHNIN